MSRKICILDDDRAFLQHLSAELAGAYEVVTASSADRFRGFFAPRVFDLVVLDMQLEAAREGLDVLREIHRIDPLQPVVVATAYADTETYLEALQAGALLYVDKQRHSTSALALLFDAVIQQGRLKRDQAAAIRALERADPLDLVGVSEEARQLRREIERIARRADLPVVIIGESGSGRELVARNLHARRQGGSAQPLCVLPSTSLSATDTIRLLFGAETDASRRRGLLEDCHGGGLVIRAADRLPVEVIQLVVNAWSKREFRPLGSDVPRPLEMALFVICEDGRFFQTNFPTHEIIEVPPLRDRKEDIPLLASYFLESMRRRGREGASMLDAEAGNILLAHDWPGNVAELKATLEYASLRAAETSSSINLQHLPVAIGLSVGGGGVRSGTDWNLEYQEARTQMALVEAAIRELATTNKTKLAGFLHVPTPTTLSRRIERSLDRYPDLANAFPRAADAFAKDLATPETARVQTPHEG